MEPEIFGYQGWKREQIASLKRVRENFGIVILFLPMSLIELAISICLTVLLIPFIFSRGINRFLRGIFFMYKKSDIKFIEYAMSQDPIHHTKSAQSYAKEFAEKEDKFLTDFAA